MADAPTDTEWQSFNDPLPMLFHLRGTVSEGQIAEQKAYSRYLVCGGAGIIYGGSGEYIDATQCRLFILRCAERLLDLSIDEPSRRALHEYRRFVLEGAPHDRFEQACRRIGNDIQSGEIALVERSASSDWTDDPLGAAKAAWHLYWTIANVKAKDSVAVTCANATKDDWWYWGSGPGPPDEVWQATRAAEEAFQADLLREIVGNPFPR